MVDLLLDDHRRLRALMNEQSTLLDAHEPDDGKIARLRVLTANLVRNYYDRERVLVDGLRRPDPVHPNNKIVEQYHRDFQAAYLQFNRNTRLWNIQAVRSDWHAYRNASRALMICCTDFLDWVETVVHPLIEQAPRSRQASMIASDKLAPRPTLVAVAG